MGKTKHPTPDGDERPGRVCGLSDIQATALRLLARREHSRGELHAKLCRRGFDAHGVDRVLAGLEADGDLSDERYARGFVRNRLERGLGTNRIRSELTRRGLPESLIEVALGQETAGDDGWERLEAVRSKKFGPEKPHTYQDKARQARFLQYRGFPMDRIRRLIFD